MCISAIFGEYSWTILTLYLQIDRKEVLINFRLTIKSLDNYYKGFIILLYSCTENKISTFYSIKKKKIKKRAIYAYWNVIKYEIKSLILILEKTAFQQYIHHTIFTTNLDISPLTSSCSCDYCSTSRIKRRQK